MSRATIRTTYDTESTILSRQGAWQADTVIVSSADVTANANGQKILLKGTILGSATEEQTILTDKAKAKAVNGAASEGIAMNTVDVTNGDMEVAMLYTGTVGIDRIPVAPTAAALAALPRITFTAD